MPLALFKPPLELVDGIQLKDGKPTKCKVLCRPNRYGHDKLLIINYFGQGHIVIIWHGRRKRTVISINLLWIDITSAGS